jgi:hypothetical protein
MTTDQAIDKHKKATQRLSDLIGVLKFQRINYPDELTWFQRALIHLEHSAWTEVKMYLEMGEQKEPRYKLHKSLRLKVNRLIIKMHQEDEQ